MLDILLDAITFEPLIANGDFVTGESTLQHQYLLLWSEKGDWRQFPDVGVGINGFLKDEDEADMLAEIKAQFEKDGMQFNSVEITESGLLIDAPYRNG